MAEAAPTPAPAAAPTPAQAPAEVPGATRGADGKFTKAEAQAQAQLVKLLNGKEMALDDVIRLATRQVGGEDRFREASELKKANDATEQKLRSVFGSMKDAKKFAAELREVAQQQGVKAEDLATEILRPLIDAELAAEEEKTLNQDQLRARKLERENAELRRKAEDTLKATETESKKKADEAHQAEVQKEVDNYDKIIVGVLKDKLGIEIGPNTPPETIKKALYIGKNIVEVMQDMRARGFPASVETVAAELTDFYRSMSLGLQEGSADVSLVSPRLLEAARKAEVERLKKENPLLNTSPLSRKKTGQKAKAEEPKDKRLTPDAIRRNLMMGKLSPRE